MGKFTTPSVFAVQATSNSTQGLYSVQQNFHNKYCPYTDQPTYHALLTLLQRSLIYTKQAYSFFFPPVRLLYLQVALD